MEKSLKLLSANSAEYRKVDLRISKGYKSNLETLKLTYI